MKRKAFLAVVIALFTLTAHAQETTNSSFVGKKNVARADKVTFQGYFDLTGFVGSFFGGPGFDLSLGARICDIVYMGFETGFSYALPVERKGDGGWIVPVGVNFKTYLPTGTKNYPFIDVSLGVAAMEDVCPFRCHIMPGCDFGRFSVAAGWERLSYASENNDLFSMKLGVRFGK